VRRKEIEATGTHLAVTESSTRGHAMFSLSAGRPRRAADLIGGYEMTSTVTTDAHTATAATALSTAEQEELIRSHMPLVGHLVRDMLSRIPNHIHRDDLTSAGLHALVTAARGWDPQRGIPFHRFASTRTNLTTTLGRTPTPEELAQALGTTTTDLNQTDTDVQRATVLSLQGFTTSSADDLVTEKTPGPEDMLIRREQIGYLHHAISSLPDRLQLVITEYFLHERPMADIAADLGVTESRISQLRAEALSLLKDGLNTHLDPDLAPTPDNPDSITARRRATYYASIASSTSMNTRLAVTNNHGHTRFGVGVPAAA
jgi:RNA polymerase sigma factor for flagellar operon FliA